jgi:hypothetical protein
MADQLGPLFSRGERLWRELDDDILIQWSITTDRELFPLPESQHLSENGL